jgi:GNAT superfamily N-acetyltransferase
MTQAPIIRPALPADIGERGQGGIRDLFNEVRRDERRHGRSPFAPPPYAAWAQAMKCQAQGKDRYQVLVAEQNHRIVGFCMATHTKNHSWTTLNKLFTKPSLHGQGIGKEFVRRIEETARRLGKEALHVCAEAGPDRASGFYRHLGFKVVDEKSSAGSKIMTNHLTLTL